MRKPVTRKYLLCPECKDTQHGWEYVGHQNMTRNGHICKKWLDYYNAKVDDTIANYSNLFPDRDISEAGAHNYCRNPNRTRPWAPWCYTDITTDPPKLAYCNISSCSKFVLCVYLCV